MFTKRALGTSTWAIWGLRASAMLFASSFGCSLLFEAEPVAAGVDASAQADAPSGETSEVRYPLTVATESATERPELGTVMVSPGELGLGVHHIALRFRDVILDPEQVVDAYVEFTQASRQEGEDSTSTTECRIALENSSSPMHFTDTFRSLSTREYGEERLTWVIPPWGPSYPFEEDYRTPSLVPLLQPYMSKHMTEGIVVADLVFFFESTPLTGRRLAAGAGATGPTLVVITEPGDEP